MHGRVKGQGAMSPKRMNAWWILVTCLYS